MDKRYQVFVSSTYVDLKEERENVIQTLMQMDCIPAGMELFPASDDQQWEFIKKIIDDCDYYLLIIGGRYGSLSASGISYTEKEFDYAVEKGLKVIALVHGKPNKIPVDKSESTALLKKKLTAFRKKVTTGRLVKYWSTASELPGMVLSSLMLTIKTYPAVGWVRANQFASTEILTELLQLKNENTELKLKLAMTEKHVKKGVSVADLTEIADFTSKFTINGYYIYYVGSDFQEIKTPFTYEVTWEQIFSLISPFLITKPDSSEVNSTLSSYLLDTNRVTNYEDSSIINYDFDTITLQLKAYGLINLNSVVGNKTRWELTEKGEKIMLKQRVIK